MEYVLMSFIKQLGKEDESFIKQMYAVIYTYLEKRGRI